MKLSKHGLGQLRHLDLLALTIEADAASSQQLLFRLGALSRDQLIDVLTRKGTLARLAARADSRLEPS